jgi:hypothetical protein
LEHGITNAQSPQEHIGDRRVPDRIRFRQPHRFHPFVGFLFSQVLNIIGWGVVIRTKFGTKENWFRKK